MVTSLFSPTYPHTGKRGPVQTSASMLIGPSEAKPEELTNKCPAPTAKLPFLFCLQDQLRPTRWELWILREQGDSRGEAAGARAE